MTPLHSPYYIVKRRPGCDTIGTRNYRLICVMRYATLEDVAIKMASIKYIKGKTPLTKSQWEC
ncbi:hypothetical protein J2Z49_002546 [Desulfofundulus luciae]|uniref:Uncharacterized protein n=1 Tax=Desulfofundulus luciae TaxID=74702 RepID=A0ABU0B4I0_9FIRM|nr:hypothetical protein [Desulfofundulus luciae]